MRTFALLALGAPLAAAIEFQSPLANSTVVKGSNLAVSWSTVDTDPTSFSLYLVNFLNWPPYYTPLEFNVETGAGEATVRIPCDAETAPGFQINAINGTNVYIIYAQTGAFSVGGAACTDPTPPPTCPPAATATVTVTVSGNSTLTPAAPAVTSTYAGRCPETIGWDGGYASPVTLTHIPRADHPLATLPAGGYYTVPDSGVGSGPQANKICRRSKHKHQHKHKARHF